MVEIFNQTLNLYCAKAYSIEMNALSISIDQLLSQYYCSVLNKWIDYFEIRKSSVQLEFDDGDSNNREIKNSNSNLDTYWVIWAEENSNQALLYATIWGWCKRDSSWTSRTTLLGDVDGLNNSMKSAFVNLYN